MSAADQFDPYVVCRVVGARVDCALWILPDGRQSLALFLTELRAAQYRDALKLGDDWRVVRPTQSELVKLLSASYGSGVRQAVLDPDVESAGRLFDLRQVLHEMGALDA
jgi:hypothetical protein